MELELRINGVISSQDVAPNETLLALLEREGYTSVKHGCETGECGACTVLVDGVPRPSCVMLAPQVAGCTISTVESLGSADKLHPLQATFAELGATGCGFCTSGMLLSASALLKKNPSPTEEDVRDALSGNLCRCLGYARPVQAVLRAAAILRGEKVEPLKQQIMQVEAAEVATESALGENGVTKATQVAAGAASSTLAGSRATTRLPVVTPGMTTQMKTLVQPASIDGHAQTDGKALIPRNALPIVTGKSLFAGDINLRNMAYGRVLASPHPHAVIRKIDILHAKALPGVLAVLTYKDVPRIPYSRVEWKQGCELIQDRYCLDNVVRYVGDRVAVVVAETPEVADQALDLINVEYDVQSPILDQRQALEPMAPRVHSEMDSKGILDAARNIAARVRSEIGDVERGFAEADQIVESEYVVPPTQQAPLERHTVISYLDREMCWSYAPIVRFLTIFVERLLISWACRCASFVLSSRRSAAIWVHARKWGWRISVLS